MALTLVKIAVRHPQVFVYVCASGEARSSVVPFLQARVSFAGQQGAAETPLHCSPVLCTPSSRPTEDHCPGLAGLAKSNPLELGSITEVGMIASHPGRKRQGPPHCCQQDASTLQFASHSTILARPELILRLLFFLQSGCLAGLQGGRELCWAWWSRNTERLQLSPHFRVRFHSSLPADSFPWLSDRKPNSAYPMVNAQAAACSGSSPHGPLAEGEAVLSNQVTPRVMLSRALSFRPWDITNNTVQGLSCGSVGEGRGEAETLKVDAKILTCAFFLGRAYLDLPWETECFTTLKMSEPWIWCSPHSLLCKSSLHMLSV